MSIRWILRAVPLVAIAATYIVAHLFVLSGKGLANFGFAEAALLLFTAELTVIAAWMVLGPGTQALRIAGGAFGCLLVWLTLFRLGMRLPLIGTAQESAVLSCMLIAIFVSLSACLFSLAAKILRVNCQAPPWKIDKLPGGQFGIRHLFALTLAAAIVIATARAVWPHADITRTGIDWFNVGVLCWLFAFTAAVVPPFALGCLAATHSRRLFVTLLVICAFDFVFVCVAEAVTFGIMFSEIRAQQAVSDFGLIVFDNAKWNSVQISPILVNFLAIRLAGFRLVSTESKRS